eukprot:g6532.t1
MTDYDQFIARASTFHPTTWCGHSDAISPLVCSRFGWRNVAFDVLQCDDCGIIYPFIERNPDEDDERTDTEYYEALLQNSHDKDCPWRRRSCPPAFLRLQLQSMEETVEKFLNRFDAFDRLWDFPVFTDPVLQEQENLTLLLEFLNRRQNAKYEDSTLFQLEDGKNRTRRQMILALLGWELNWSSKFVFLLEEAENFILPKYSLGFENDPLSTGVCFGRQTYLTCRICNAKIGLWSVKTNPDCDISMFQTLSGQKKSIKGPLSTGVKRPREEVVPQKQQKPKYSFLEKRPIFGMKKFARTVLPEKTEPVAVPVKTGGSDEKQQQDFSACHPVHAEYLFDPIGYHRPFCPYLQEWQILLATITEGGKSVHEDNFLPVHILSILQDDHEKVSN